MAGTAFLIGCCAAAAAAAVHSLVVATALLLCSAAGITAAEMIHTVTSWELAVALAPPDGRNRYVGVHGIAQAGERAGGPVVIADGVLAAGPLSWPVLGAGLFALSLAQRRVVRRRVVRT